MNRMTPPRKHAPLSAADTEIAGAHAYPCGFETLRTSVYDISSTRASRQIRRLSPPSYVFSISICSTNLLPKPTRCRSFPVGHLAIGQNLNQVITPPTHIPDGAHRSPQSSQREFNFVEAEMKSAV